MLSTPSLHARPDTLGAWLGRFTLLQRLRGWFALMIAVMVLLLGHRLGTATEALRNDELAVYGFALAACIFLLAVVPGRLRRLCHEVGHLTAVARRLSAGDFTARPQFIPAAELGELAQAFQTLQTALARHARELRERELEARAASDAKSMFLACMSHEIRTPLVGLIGMLELLGRTPLTPEQRGQFDVVGESARALQQIVGDILDYSKIEAGKLDIETAPVCLRQVCTEVVSMFSAAAQSRGLQLAHTVDPAVAPSLLADGLRLKQVLRNFVANAVKFTERGGVTLSVRVVAEESRGQRLRFAVTDTGIGMTPEQVGRLFEPFTQADAGTARRFGGTGLGLAICRRLVEAMGGTISINSAPGLGTVISLELLLDRAELKVPVAREHPGEQATGPGISVEHRGADCRRVLVAEDHPVNRRVLSEQLRIAGLQVDVAEDGTLALQKFGAGHYALVLTDLHMPGLDGYELVKAIRQLENRQARPRTPVIALTADIVKENVDRCFASDMDDYLCKPATIQQLTEKIAQWLPGWAAAPNRSLGKGAEPVTPASVPCQPIQSQRKTGTSR